MSLLHNIGKKPIIAALRNPSQIEVAIQSSVDNIFFMGGTVTDVIRAVQKAKEHSKGTFIHLDLVKGISNSDKESIEFLYNYVGADGVVSPKSHLIKEAMKIGLYGILHLFIIDSIALKNGIKMVESVSPDGVELMPGIIGKVISNFADSFENIPIIASGLIQNKSEVNLCLQSGATALSVSEQKLWHLTYDSL